MLNWISLLIAGIIKAVTDAHRLFASFRLLSPPHNRDPPIMVLDGKTLRALVRLSSMACGLLFTWCVCSGNAKGISLNLKVTNRNDGQSFRNAIGMGLRSFIHDSASFCE